MFKEENYAAYKELFNQTFYKQMKFINHPLKSPQLNLML